MWRGTITYTKSAGAFVASACGGTYTNTWTAKDACNNTSAVFTQVITITDTKAPTWTTVAAALNVTVECDDAAGLTAAQGQTPVATDNCPGTITYTTTAGAFVASACGGTYTNTWTAKDEIGRASCREREEITVVAES